MLSATSKPYIDASVPVLREHGLTITTAFYKNLFLAHPELKNLFNAGNQANGSQQQSLASAVFAYAANIENAAALAAVIERIVHKHVSVGIKAEHYPIVGQHLIGAIKEVLGDQATPELLAAWVEAYGLLADALIEAEHRLYQTNQHAPGERMKLIVTDKQKQSEHVVSYTLSAKNNQPLPTFKAGQYVSVSVFIESLKLQQIRQYSLSDSPKKDTYRITVKGEQADASKPAGTVSNWLHAHLEVGSEIDVSHPYGNFTADIDAKTPIALISAGVGITPMLSMLHSIADTNPSRKVLFAHTAKSASHISHADEITAAKNNMAALTVKLFLGEVSDGHADTIKGRMDLKTLCQTADKETVYYLCGPQAFMDEQRKSLLAIGVDGSQIHREVFGPESLNHQI
jgi:nitric oxide dioxygenase